MKQVAPPWQLPKAPPYTIYSTFYRESKQLYLIHINKHREASTSKTQRNIAQMKEQNKTPGKELSEMEIANLSDAEFKTLVIRMLKELNEYDNKIKKTQEEVKVTLSEMKKKFTGNQQWRG